MEIEQDFSDVTTSLKGTSGFDANAFERLLEDTNANAVLRILARFSMSLEEAILVLNRGIQTQEVEPIWKAAHKLAGSAEMLGFREFGLKSKQLSSHLKYSSELRNHSDEVNTYIHDARTLHSNVLRVFPNLKSYL